MTTDHVRSTAPTTDSAERSAPVPSLWRPGLAAGVVAAVATLTIAAVARGLDVSLEAEPGERIPVASFAELTLVFTVVGVLIAHAFRRWARSPRSTFIRTTVALTALSLVPDVTLSTDAATKVTLVLSHLVAAAIVIPVLSSRLPAHRRA